MSDVVKTCSRSPCSSTCTPPLGSCTARRLMQGPPPYHWCRSSQASFGTISKSERSLSPFLMAVDEPPSRSSLLSIGPGRSFVQDCVRVRFAAFSSSYDIAGDPILYGSAFGPIEGLWTEGWPTHCNHSVYQR